MFQGVCKYPQPQKISSLSCDILSCKWFQFAKCVVVLVELPTSCTHSCSWIQVVSSYEWIKVI
jgi:hypothetical protein